MRRNDNKIELTCSVCGKTSRVNTSNPAMYTEAVRKAWTCWAHSGKGVQKRQPNKHKEEVMSPKTATVAPVDEGRIVVSEELQTIFSKLNVPQIWKNTVREKHEQGARTVKDIKSEFMTLIDAKARVRAGGNLEERKRLTKEIVTRTIDKVLSKVAGA